MDFEYSSKTRGYIDRLEAFFDTYIYPNEQTYMDQMEAFGTNRWQIVQIIEDLKPKARDAGLWNMFLPDSERGGGLTNLEYAPLCEIMGRVGWSGEVFNCSAPDTGNMEILERYGSQRIKDTFLQPLLDGEIRSAFAMTEPAVASSDATNIECAIVRDGDEYVINGRKWWTSGIMDPRCKVMIVMGKTDPDADRHTQQSQVIVPVDTPGVKIERFLPVFGYDDAPHGHGQVLFEDVRVPVDNLLHEEGKGFEISQARLGPGRIHHCMRTIGVAERTLEKMCDRITSRVAFGRTISEYSTWLDRVAEARIDIEQCRLLTLKAAYMMDTVGNQIARMEIAMIKVAAPNMALRIIDNAIQAFGGAGVTSDPGLARAYASMRTLRLADGPDEVHLRTIGRLELGRQAARAHDAERQAAQ